MQRREFLNLAATATAAVPALGAASEHPAEGPSAHRFKIGIYLGELDLPFDESLAFVKEQGGEYVWFNQISGDKPLARMSDAEIDGVGERVARHGLKIFLLNAGNPFKQIHLTDLSSKHPLDFPAVKQELADLVRSMAIARRLQVEAVGCFTFAWPGEYSAGKPTWPMRYATRGGIIAEVDFDKLVRVFEEVVRQAEQQGVNVALSMMPWNYTNTTSNFRRLVERINSPRLRVMWGPADNWNSGEWDVATTGFQNIRPFLHGLHLKDLHVQDGPQLKFEYKPLGEGDVDYVRIFRQLRAIKSEAILSVSTHFQTPSRNRQEAMRINVRNLRALLKKSETPVSEPGPRPGK